MFNYKQTGQRYIVLSPRDADSYIVKNILMNSDRDKRSLIITYPNALKDKEIVRTIQKLGYKAGITASPQQGNEVTYTRQGSRVTYGYCTSTCSASSSTWKEFYQRYFTKNK